MNFVNFDVCFCNRFDVNIDFKNKILIFRLAASPTPLFANLQKPSLYDNFSQRV